MIKAVLEYRDCSGDKNIVNKYLAQSNVQIVKTKSASFTCDKKVSVLAKCPIELNNLVAALNEHTKYGVSVIRSRKAIDMFGFWI